MFHLSVLVIQNFENTGLGLVGRALEEAGHSHDLVAAHDGFAVPASPGDHDALIVLGGGQNALDDEGSPWLPDLVALMRDFADAGKAVLGICLGAQLLARALGGKNHIGTASEFAWKNVELTEAGRRDPLFSQIEPMFSAFQWHDDTFSLPPGAVHLATNAAAPVQAFRFGRAAYGIQFHFEADRALVENWNATFAEYLAETQPGWPERHPVEAARHGPGADEAGQAIARAWVALI